MLLKVYLRVKFRAFFVTFGVIERTFEIPLPLALPPQKYVDLDERGVRLVVETV